MKYNNVKLYHIKETVQGVIDAQRAYMEARDRGASLERLEELARIIAYVAGLVPVQDVKDMVELLENEKRAA